MTKAISGILLLFLALASARTASARTVALNAYLFYGEGCPHCAQERLFLNDTLKDAYPDLRIHEYEIYSDRDNALLLRETAETLEVDVEGIPFLVIGDEHFIGYADGFSSQAIERRVRECIYGGCPDSVSTVVGATDSRQSQPNAPEGIGPETMTDGGSYAENRTGSTTSPDAGVLDERGKTVRLPLLGEVDATSLSLPVLTAVMGALDGFNPCAMWALVFLIGLLLGMKDRKRMWLLGSAFIAASASVYFLFMSAWLNLIIFLGFVAWIRLLIGLSALFAGGYGIREFLLNKEARCKMSGNEERRMAFGGLRASVQRNNLWLALGGIIVLAFAVNLVELVCSAGLPAIYTQVLALNEMPAWRHYAYISLYMLFFMLDDLLVFLVAMKTLQITGASARYSRLSRLVGGCVMVVIGLSLIFKPEWLMFG